MIPPPPRSTPLSLHDALPIFRRSSRHQTPRRPTRPRIKIVKRRRCVQRPTIDDRSEEHTSELQSRGHLVCRLLLEKKKKKKTTQHTNITKTKIKTPRYNTLSI